jgi:tetratricopeptide (TPR) repeat protein
VQVLYVARAAVPASLSADYSYKELPLVMGLDDARAWGGLLLAATAAWAFRYRPGVRLPLALWVVPFLPTANLLFPIGTMMAERLAYLPSLGLALGGAMLLGRLDGRRLAAVAAAFLIVFSAVTVRRNLVWKDADSFYPALAASAPGSARAWYSLAVWHASRMRDPEALAAYDRAVAIFLPYPEAWNNRGNVLVALGRLEEAKESYARAVRFDPGHRGAAASLQALEAGIPFVPQRKKL